MSNKEKKLSSPTPENQFVHHYRLDKTIGQGTYGKVKLAYDIRTGEKVAVKVLEKANIKSEKQVSRIQREIRFLKLLHHPHIVKVYDVMETQDSIFIVMEYATGGELFDYIVAHKRVKEKEARSFFRQVISAVDYCHQNAVIHRDLKPENLLLDQNKNIKIIDFGFGNTYKTDGLLETFCGSPFYAAPEMILGKRYEGPEVDMWSLGVILFALLCGHLPFDDENMKELYKKIAHGTYTIPDYVPAPCKQLIQRMITVDSRKRATLDEIKNHPWVSEGYDGPPENHLPKREAIEPDDVDKNIIQRMQAFGFKPEDVVNAFKEYSEQTKKAIDVKDKKTKFKVNPVVTTYFLLSEMLKREEAKLMALEAKEREKHESSHESSPKHDRKLSLQPKKTNAPMSPSPLSGTHKSSNNLFAIAEDTQKVSTPVIAHKSSPKHQPSKTVPVPIRLSPEDDASSTSDDSIRTSVSSQGRPATASAANNNLAVPQKFLHGVGKDGKPLSGSTNALMTEREQRKSVDHSTPALLSPRSPSPVRSKAIKQAVEEDDGLGPRRLSLQVTKTGSVKPNANQPSSNSPTSPARKLTGSTEVRQVSGWFLNVSTTSSKPPEEIMAEVQRVLTSLNYAGVRHEKDSQWTVNVEVQVGPFNQAVEYIPSRNVTQDSGTSEVEYSDHQSDHDEEPDSSTDRRSSLVPSVPSSSLIRRISTFGNDFLTRSNAVSFQIEICHVSRLNMYGLHFKRMTGSVWSYKSVCSRLLSRMNL